MRLKESINQNQINLLKATYGDIKKINPNSPAVKKLMMALKKLSKDDLETLSKAKINFVSTMAQSILRDSNVSESADIEIFKNKVDLETGIKKYTSNGFVKESVNEDVNFRDGKYRFYSKQGVGYLTYDGREISSGDFDWEDGSNSYWMYHSSWRGQKAFDTGKDVIAYFKSKKITTESVNEADLNWNAVQNAIINFLKVNTKILDKKVQAKDTEGVKGGLKSIISGLTNAQRSLNLESVKKSTFIKVARISNNGKLDIY